MKRRDLERKLRELGWVFARHGSRHDVWRKGVREECVPRHRDVAEKLAHAILRRAARGEIE